MDTDKTKINKEKSLNDLKDRVEKTSGITSDKASKDNLDYIVNNIYAGGKIGGLMTKDMVEKGEKELIKKYENKYNTKMNDKK